MQRNTIPLDEQTEFGQPNQVDISNSIQLVLDLLKKNRPKLTATDHATRAAYVIMGVASLGYILVVITICMQNKGAQEALDSAEKQMQDVINDYNNQELRVYGKSKFCNQVKPLNCHDYIDDTYANCRPYFDEYCGLFNNINILYQNLGKSIAMTCLLYPAIAPAAILYVLAFQRFANIEKDRNRLSQYGLSSRELDNIKVIASEVNLKIDNNSQGDEVTEKLTKHLDNLQAKEHRNRGWMHRLFSCCGRKKKDSQNMPSFPELRQIKLE